MKFFSLLSAAGLLLCAIPNANASDEPCAELAAQVSQAQSTNVWNIPAELGLACLQSVPFVKSDAAEFIRFFNASILQFQSTTDYLKNPPPTYQQPAVDLQAGISEIQDNVDADHYENQYDFEADVYQLLQAAHDGHLAINTGALSTFYFQGPYQLISVSYDGQDLPAIYSASDLTHTVSGEAKDWNASPLKTVNGQDPFEYLARLAAYQSTGGLEPHTDWNSLMTSAAHSIEGKLSDFQALTLFPDPWFNATFENGTVSAEQYLLTPRRLALKSLSQITSGQDYYQKFVKPSSTDDTTTSRSTPIRRTKVATRNENATPLSRWPASAYPSPAVVEENLGNTGWTTGYLLEGSSVGVLSVPTFELDFSTFRASIQDFLSQAKRAGIQHILIDVQENGGGYSSLATELFRHFFPSQDPYLLSQFPITSSSNYLGNFFSQQWAENKTLGPNKAITPWAAQQFVDPTTNAPYADWSAISNGEMYGSGRFTKRSLPDDKNDPQFTELFGYGGQTVDKTQPYEAKDIAILSDGHCASTCALLIELMQYQSGVRVIAAGGFPQAGPMQGAGGTRGAQSYTLKQIQGDIMFTKKTASWHDSEATRGLNNAVSGTGINVQGGEINLRNLVRKDQYFPQQFAYEPADCRIFFTPETFNNYTALWTYAATALWKDSSLCVANSTTELMEKYSS